MGDARSHRDRRYAIVLWQKWMRFFDAVGTNIALFRIDALRPWGNQPRPQTHQYHFLRARDVQSLRRREGTITSLEVLQEFHGLLASDPRDIIYAAVNLANDKAAKGLVPDYENPVSEVHIERLPSPTYAICQILCRFLGPAEHHFQIRISSLALFRGYRDGNIYYQKWSSQNILPLMMAPKADSMMFVDPASLLISASEITRSPLNSTA
jgi:hypothetical protein